MKNSVSLLLALVCALPIADRASAAQELALGTPFADNAILQREMKVPVWGWSEPGAKVAVEFSGQKKEATAGESGKWMIELEPLEASAEPTEMVVSESGGKSITLKNILVGEVWMASGQSNMQWVAAKCDVNPLFPALRSGPMAGSGAYPQSKFLAAAAKSIPRICWA